MRTEMFFCMKRKNNIQNLDSCFIAIIYVQKSGIRLSNSNHYD